MNPTRFNRLRVEFDRWRLVWQEVETYLDRVEGSRAGDAPHQARCAALHDAAIAIEHLRLRRDRKWLPPGLRMQSGGSPVVAEAFAARKYELPGPLDLEIAAAGLIVDEDGKPLKSPPKVKLFGTEYLFDVWNPDTRQFEALLTPVYSFGKLLYPPPQSQHPWIPLLFLAPIAQPEIGENDGSDDSLFSYPRRQAAADEGATELKAWSALREQRLQAIEEDAVMDSLVDGQPEFDQLAQLVSNGDFASARTLVGQARTLANADLGAIAAGMAQLTEFDAEDEALPALAALESALAEEVADLNTLIGLLQSTPTAEHRSQAAALVAGLPQLVMLAPHAAKIYTELDLAIDERIAYPDGPLRSLRLLEVATAKMWRARKVWFSQRTPQLARLGQRFLSRFRANLTSLVTTGSSDLTNALLGSHVAVATAAGADLLPLDAPASALIDLKRGDIAVLSGARPALAIVLGVAPPASGSQRIRISPLRVSLARGVGLDGIPGLVNDGVSLGRSLSRLVTGDELCRGRRAGEPEADGIVQDVAALWSRLKLLQGGDFTLALPAPFDSNLALPVQATPSVPLEARAPSLLLPTGAYDATRDPPEPLVAAPGELLLLRGRDADGLWWQAAVTVEGSEVTTLEAQGVSPVEDPSSPICCQAETPVVMLTLAQNTLPVPLCSHVTLHRSFLGFGWPTLAIGKILPAMVDDRTQHLVAIPSGNGFSFGVGDQGEPVDRAPELEAATHVLDLWLGGR
ncbi:MAG TPA: hypothetical protein VFU02_18900 [Polyangiaceae bacterium]|nr:hypothetical protein [Polyangiaceae bacterium]